MDPESPELIEAELAATRESLAAKLDAAEHTTVGAIREVITTLEGDVKSVGDVVTDTVGVVRQEAVAGLRDALGELDPRPSIRRNPYAAVGGAVLGGLVVGLFALRDRVPRHVTAAAKGTDTRESPDVGHTPTRAMGPLGGFVHRLADKLMAQLERAGEEVADTLTTAVSEQIETLKSTVNRQVTEGAQHLTQKVAHLIPSVGGEKEPASPRASGCYAG